MFCLQLEILELVKERKGRLFFFCSGTFVCMSLSVDAADTINATY
jgi:hypothetical protein